SLPLDQDLLAKDRDQLNGFWMQTFTGIQFYPYRATPDMVHILDIARALSMMCRFGGHLGRFYSVAQHSVLVSRLVPEEYALEALLHDAVEAYIGDMVMPVKRGQTAFCDLESEIWQNAIAPKFDLPPEMSPEVRDADIRMLIVEKREIVSDFGHSWGDWLEAVPDTTEVSIEPMGPDEAFAFFLGRYVELL